jgi:hypothetical protein
VKHLEKYLELMQQCCSTMPDKRHGSNMHYPIADFGLAAFSIFFMQHPSFLSFQRTLHANPGKNNTQTLFQMESIPSDNHIRQMLDGVPLSHFNSVFFLL